MWWLFRVFNMEINIITRLFLIVSTLMVLWIVKWSLCTLCKTISRWKVTAQVQSFKWEGEMCRAAKERGGGVSSNVFVNVKGTEARKWNYLPEVSQELSGRLNPDLLRPKAKFSLQDYRDSQRIREQHTKPKPTRTGALYIQAWHSHSCQWEFHVLNRTRICF